VTWAVREKGYSQRRACGLVGLHPKTYRYASKRTGDEEIRAKLRELASQRRRFGYRRLGLMLKRQGIKLSPKKLYRLYKEERLTVRKRGGRKRALGTRAPMAIPQDRNLRWSLDFVMDTRSVAGASESSPWSMTAPGNAWAWWWIPRSARRGSCASSTASSRREARRA
jgi:putative transposase